jgi:FkbM family methyltransferase
MKIRLRGHGVRRRFRAAAHRLLGTPPEPWLDTRNRRDNEHLRLLAAFSLGPDANCIDVGSHEGSFLEEARRVAPSGRHIAFEPLPEYAARLREAFPTVEVREAAAAETAGRSRFVRVAGAEGMSGLRERTYGRPVRLEEIEVATERLDDVLPADYVPALIKIDVEGAELGVLRGARETLERHHPIIAFEHGVGGADHYGTTPGDVYRLLVDELGYRIFDIDGAGPYTPDGFDATFTSPRVWNFVAHR